MTASPHPVEGEENAFTVDYRWSFGPDREFDYDTEGDVTKSGDDWRITWSPQLLHMDLQPGQNFVYSQDSDLQVPVLDRTGQSLFSWQTVGVITLERAALTSAPVLAPLLAPFEPTVTADSITALFDGNTDDRVTVMKLREADLTTVAGALATIPGVTVRQQGELLTTDRNLASPALAGLPKFWHDRITANSGWSVSLVDDSGALVQRLAATPPKPTEPVRTTLDLRLRLLAQQAVAIEPRPTILVAISGATGGILAAAQNQAANIEGRLPFRDCIRLARHSRPSPPPRRSKRA